VPIVLVGVAVLGWVFGVLWWFWSLWLLACAGGIYYAGTAESFKLLRRRGRVLGIAGLLYMEHHIM